MVKSKWLLVLLIGLFVLNSALASQAVVKKAKSVKKTKQITLKKVKPAKKKAPTVIIREEQPVRQFKPMRISQPLSNENLPTPGSRQAHFQLDGGYMGGAGLLGAGYFIPAGPLDVGATGGVSIGSGFSVIIANLSARIPFDIYFIGVEAGMANYSKTVKNVPGISGTIGGSNTGGGLYVGAKVDPLVIRGGFNSVLGINAVVSYVF